MKIGAKPFFVPFAPFPFTFFMLYVHFHDLRHTAASHLLMAGVDLRTLAEIIEHKTLKMVHRYTYLLNEHKLKTVDLISSLGSEYGSSGPSSPALLFLKNYRHGLHLSSYCFRRKMPPAITNYYVKYSLHNDSQGCIMSIMINNNQDTNNLLIRFGERLKTARLSRNESQELFAQRLGITRQSYSKMEKGSPQTPIGNWLNASSILGRLQGWQDVLTEQEDLFAQFESKSDSRKRAGSKRKKQQ